MHTDTPGKYTDEVHNLCKHSQTLIYLCAYIWRYEFYSCVLDSYFDKHGSFTLSATVPPAFLFSIRFKYMNVSVFVYVYTCTVNIVHVM